MTTSSRPKSRARPRHGVRIYLKQGEVVGYGHAPQGQHTSVELVGFTPAHANSGNILALAGELLSRAHLAGSVDISLRDTDPAAADSLAYLLRCVGVEVTQIRANE